MLKIEIEGLDDVQRRFAETGRRAQALDGVQRVSFADLFPPTFVAEHTEFETMQAMFAASGLFESATEEFGGARLGDDVAAVLNGQEWTELVARRTVFSDWREMQLKAFGERTFRRLTDGLGKV